MSRRTGLAVSLCLGVSFFAAACGEDHAPSSSLAGLGRPHVVERDPRLTPGALCSRANPDFDGLRYPERIVHCRREVSSGRKVAIAAAYGISAEDRGDFEIDHFIPLNIGGSNEDRNLWPLYVPLAREKSRYEAWLMEHVASGRMLQAVAIERIKAWRPGLVYDLED